MPVVRVEIQSRLDMGTAGRRVVGALKQLTWATVDGGVFPDGGPPLDRVRIHLRVRSNSASRTTPSMAIMVLGTIVDSESGARLRVHVVPGIYASLFLAWSTSLMVYGCIATHTLSPLGVAGIHWLVCILYFRSKWKDIRREVARAFGV